MKRVVVVKTFFVVLLLISFLGGFTRCAHRSPIEVDPLLFEEMPLPSNYGRNIIALEYNSVPYIFPLLGGLDGLLPPRSYGQYLLIKPYPKMALNPQKVSVEIYSNRSHERFNPASFRMKFVLPQEVLTTGSGKAECSELFILEMIGKIFPVYDADTSKTELHFDNKDDVDIVITRYDVKEGILSGHYYVQSKKAPYQKVWGFFDLQEKPSMEELI